MRWGEDGVGRFLSDRDAEEGVEDPALFSSDVVGRYASEGLDCAKGVSGGEDQQRDAREGRDVLVRVPR